MNWILVKRPCDRGSEAARRERLAEPRDALEQHVPLAQHAQQHVLQKRPLADHGPAHLGEQSLGAGAVALHPFPQRGVVWHAEPPPPSKQGTCRFSA